jgi:hypothetical protein
MYVLNTSCCHINKNILAFGFAAALLETLPFVGLIFSISNQVGAAMWAYGM